MRSAVALILVLTVSTLGCFPKDAHKRTLAQFGEGGTIVAGIAIEAFLGTGADCDKMTKIGEPIDQSCHDRATLFGDIGVALMLAGMLGFVATISTAEDIKEPPPIDIKAQPDTAKDLKLPPGVKANQVATPPAEAAQTPPPAPPPPAAGSDAVPAAN